MGAAHGRYMGVMGIADETTRAGILMGGHAPWRQTACRLVSDLHRAGAVYSQRCPLRFAVIELGEPDRKPDRAVPMRHVQLHVAESHVDDADMSLTWQHSSGIQIPVQFQKVGSKSNGNFRARIEKILALSSSKIF